MTEPDPPSDEWDDYEEDGPMDLEEQLDRALDRAFPATPGVATPKLRG